MCSQLSFFPYPIFSSPVSPFHAHWAHIFLSPRLFYFFLRLLHYLLLISLIFFFSISFLFLCFTIDAYWSYISSDADVRLARRISRDTVERGRDIQSVLEQARHFYFYNCMYACFEIVTSYIRSATSLPQVAKSWGGDVVGSNKNNKKWRYLLIERSRAENIGGEINKVWQALQAKTSYVSVNNTEPDRWGTSAYDIMFVFHGLTMVGWWRWWTCVVVSSFIFHGLFSVEQVMNKIALAEGGSITWICGMMLGLP